MIGSDCYVWSDVTLAVTVVAVTDEVSDGLTGDATAGEWSERWTAPSDSTAGSECGSTCGMTGVAVVVVSSDLFSVQKIISQNGARVQSPYQLSVHSGRLRHAARPRQ